MKGPIGLDELLRSHGPSHWTARFETLGRLAAVVITKGTVQPPARAAVGTTAAAARVAAASRWQLFVLGINSVLVGRVVSGSDAAALGLDVAVRHEEALH